MSISPHRFYLAGELRSSQEQCSVVNPWNGELVGTVGMASIADASEAVTKCRAGFLRTRKLAGYERAAVLKYVASRVHAQREEFAALITAETAKPIQFSRIEVERAVMTFDLAADEARRIDGEAIPLDLSAAARGRLGVVRRFPLGLVLCVTPFNFPLNLVAHKIAPAIAAGNAFILKPSPRAPLTSLKLAAIIAESGYPRDAFAVLPCSNEVAGELVRDDRIDMLSFTGSAAVGWTLREKAGKKKVVLELGGNAAVIVDANADVDDAVKKNVAGAFGSSGQVCIKVQRILVHESLYDEYRGKFVEAARNVACGNPASSETVVGPLIDDRAAERIEKWLGEAVASGAEVIAGGKRVGRMVEPTVLTNVPREARIRCEEAFGPVVSLESFSDFNDAIAGVNDSRYGLQAGLFSNDLGHVMQAYDELRVGAVIVNDNPTFRVDSMPYGGVKDSGTGKEGVRYAIEEMTERKLLVLPSH